VFSDSSEACRNREEKEGAVEECPEDDMEFVRDNSSRDWTDSSGAVSESWIALSTAFSGPTRSLSAASAAATGAGQVHVAA